MARSNSQQLLYAAIRKKMIERKAAKMGIASAPGRAGKAGYVVRTK